MATIQNKERRSVSRQFHRKSRNSCLPCRKRRVRCDLQPPTCSNCQRRNELCSYKQQQNQALDLALISSLSYTTETWHRNGDNFFDGYVPLEYATSHMAPNVLRHVDSPQWIRQVTGVNTGSVNKVMEETFFLSWLSNLEGATLAQEFDRQANSFKYVHRIITALYALHESSQKTSHSNLHSTAYRYQIEASILFRNSQVEVNEANWLAILMFGIGVIVFQFASALEASDEDSYMELLYILRNSFGLAAQLGPYLHASPLMQFTKLHLGRLQLHLDDFTWAAICCLDSLKYPVDTTDEERRACLHSIAALKGWVIEIDGYPRNWLHYISWPAALSDHYLTLLSQKHPVALVVFIYWCCIMHRCPKRWYMVGWPNRAADFAMKYLGEQWDYILEFPRKILANEFKSSRSHSLALI
ncbi:uncharacterized protein GGS22DRAFT_154146 [Annulohypoxylon maeteangense]|uniref:uncharacterized protein n=1 Tax=Annulohypoxylon maeteangense TaxID=1927788 RepID=UPI002007E086|nr:uncharacterized protein GGS22DRAFT_154146 [Annulohypoxylon maeteangense]KAI0887741.1 hypothetical protein GGS22DRAFT_154146 [Annulohypoxylon maeteangense]